MFRFMVQYLLFLRLTRSGLVGAREEISHSLAEVLTFYSRIFPYNFEYLALRFSVGLAQV